jgi:ferritin
MISETLQKAVNEQICHEQYSAQLYLAMSAHCENLGYHGFAHWLRFQAGEETGHALRFMDILFDRKGRVELKALAAPPRDFGNLIEMFEQILRHEEEITRRIHGLFDLARAERDHASEIKLQWFVNEQVEEEASAGRILDQLKAVGLQGGSVWYLDSKLAKRAEKA